MATLADYAAQTWQREFRSLNPTFNALPAALQTPDAAEQCRYESALCRARAGQIRAAIRARDFIHAFDVMAAEGSFGIVQFRVLERAFPLMTENERGSYLQYVWCRSKSRIPAARALRLFRAVPSLRETVPTSWPLEVRVYRGAWRHRSWPKPFERAKRAVRSGISWTTDRQTAEQFARGMQGDSGCVGTATVPRSSILVYFHDPDEIDFDGVTYRVDDYREHECIIDPAATTAISYEAVEGKLDTSQ